MKAQCLPFGQIPHTTRLFLDFLAYSPKVQPFYPHSPYFKEWLKEEAGALHYDSSRRENISAILNRQNKSWNASSQTLTNLERLRNGASAVVTGQQVGLFGGPTFAIYKALTAVKLAEEATAAGVDAVPPSARCGWAKKSYPLWRKPRFCWVILRRRNFCANPIVPARLSAQHLPDSVRACLLSGE